LTQLLTEISGFAKDHPQVIIMAATNRYQVLDEALLRPGRLERHIAVPAPDLKGRKRILELHAAKLADLDPSIDFDEIARQTVGLAGANLAEIVNQAGLLKVRRGDPQVTMTHFWDALTTATIGEARPSREVSEQERLVTAVHESGHTLVALLREHAYKPHRVTIVPHGESGGATWMSGEDCSYHSKQHLLARLEVMLGGRAAEVVQFGKDNITTGAARDLKQATELAQKMVGQWGMGSRLSQVDEHSPLWEYTVNEAELLLFDAAHAAEMLIKQNEEAFRAIMDQLLERETIEAEDLQAIALAYN
jgi:ATP-dependent Zn protease